MGSMMAAVEYITAATFGAFAARRGIGVVHFWAEWDQSHLLVRQRVEVAIHRAGGSIRFAMCDTDDPANGYSMREVGIANLPTLFYFRDGERAGLQVGVQSAETIAEALMQIRAGDRLGRGI